MVWLAYVGGRYWCGSHAVNSTVGTDMEASESVVCVLGDSVMCVLGDSVVCVLGDSGVCA